MPQRRLAAVLGLLFVSVSALGDDGGRRLRAQIQSDGATAVLDEVNKALDPYQISQLADSRRGDPKVRGEAQAEPPNNVYVDRGYTDWMTNQQWLLPHTVGYNFLRYIFDMSRGQFPYCQWHARLGWNNTRQGLLDEHAMYLIQLVQTLQDDDVLRITGEFYPVLYFSYQVYGMVTDQSANARIIDSDLNPFVGRNPFREPGVLPSESGKYQIHLTKTGMNGLPNEHKANISRLGLFVARYYKNTPSESLPLDLAIVPPLFQRGKLSDPKSFNEVMPACLPEIREGAGSEESWIYWVQDVVNQRYPIEGHCPIPLASRGMHIFDNSSVPSYVRSMLIARNNDSPYLFYCIDSANLRKKGLSENNIVLKIHARLPTFPRGVYKGEPEPLVAPNNTYENRYLSFMTTGPLFPFADYEGLDGQQIEEFYNQRHPDGSWDREFTLVSSTDPSAPDRCHLMDHNNEIFLGFRQLPGQAANVPHLPDVPYNPSIVYRQQLGDPNRIGGVKAVKECSAAQKCQDEGFLQDRMGDTYPTVEFLICHTDGRVETMAPESQESVRNTDWAHRDS